MESTEGEIVATEDNKSKTNWLVRASRVLDRGISRGCARLASLVSRFPNRTIAISVVCCLICAIGWIEIDDEQQVEKLYTPQNTRAFADRDWVEDRFGDEASHSTVYLNRERSSTNLFDRGAILEAFDLYEFVLTIESEEKTRGYDERSCEQVYWDREGVEPATSNVPHTLCQKESILAFWDYNRTKFLEDPDHIATINRQDKVDCCSPSSELVSLTSVAGRFRFEDPDDPSKITGAGALRMNFLLETHLNRQSRDDPHVRRLENKFSRRLRDKSYEYFQTPMPDTGWDRSDSSDTAFDQDRIFINFAIIIIIIYAWFAMYSFADSDRSRGSLGLAAVACVLLSTIAAFGIAIGLGVTFSPSTGVAIFLVLGIGLDDSFVIAAAVDDHIVDEVDADYDPTISPLENDARLVVDKNMTIEEVTSRRIVHTLALSGPSITVTSITDAAAFVAGSFVETPDISAFNRFCAVSVLVDFAMQLTFFVAIFTLDQRRRLAAKVRYVKAKDSGIVKDSSCFLCCKKRSNDDEEEVGERQEKEIDDNAESQDAAAKAETIEESPAANKKKFLAEDELDDVEENKEKDYELSHPNPMVRFWGTTYANALLHPIGKIFVLSSIITLLAVAIVGVSQIEMDIKDDWGVVSNPALKSVNFGKKHFGSQTYQVNLYTKNTNYYENRAAFYDMLDDYVDLNFVLPGSVRDNWYSAYDTWLNETARTNSDYEEWLANIKVFLATDGAPYSQFVVIDDSKGGVVGAQVQSQWLSDGNFGGTGTRRMRKAREEVRGTPLGTVIVYERNFIWNESFNTILGDTTRAIVGASLTVLVILVLLLGDIVAAILVSFSVAFVCISTLGAVHWYNDGLNYITSFFIVIAVGLSADAPAHITKAFLESRAPTRNERARDALKTLAPSVFKGGFSTILGIAITGLCITYIFQTFFRYLLTILVLALYCGLALMPVLCSLVGPMPTYD